MKNLPTKIYLQIDADGETPEDFKDLHGISWCEDKINDNDIEYTLSNESESQRKDLLIDFLRWLIIEDVRIDKGEWFPKIVFKYLKSVNK